MRLGPRFTDADRAYATSLTRAIDVVLEYVKLDPRRVREGHAVLRDYLDSSPPHQERRRQQAASGVPTASFIDAVADWTYVHSVATHFVYRDAADLVAAALADGQSLLPSEADLDFLASTRAFEVRTTLEPPLWRHIEAVACWTGRAQFRFWEIAHAPDSPYRDIVEMKRQAGAVNEGYIPQWIRLKEGLRADVTRDKIEVYRDSLQTRTPDELLAIGGPVQHSLRALVHEYLRLPATDEPLRSAFRTIHHAPHWAESKSRPFSSHFAAAMPAGGQLSTAEWLTALSPKDDQDIGLREPGEHSGRCGAPRGSYEARSFQSMPDALFTRIGLMYGADVVPHAIRATERLTAIQLVVAAETRIFDHIEHVRQTAQRAPR